MKLKIDEFENYAKRNGVSPRLMLQKLGGGRLAYKHLKNGCALGYELVCSLFNAKSAELKGKPPSAIKFDSGAMRDTPTYMTKYEIDRLNEMDEED